MTAWWSISGEALLEALRAVAEGDSPDVVYLEMLANSECEEVEPGMTMGRKTYMHAPRRAFLDQYIEHPQERGCRICGDPHIHMRQLCIKDYIWAQKNHLLNKFPAVRDLTAPLICVCAESKPVKVHPWQAWQCDRCYRPVLGRAI